MKIIEIAEKLNAKILCCEDRAEREVHSACGSDMMSDVLAFVKDQAVLITGLTNPQVIRTAVMMDMVCVVFVRDKQPTDDMLELARAQDGKRLRANAFRASGSEVMGHWKILSLTHSNRQLS